MWIVDGADSDWGWMRARRVICASSASLWAPSPSPQWHWSLESGEAVGMDPLRMRLLSNLVHETAGGSEDADVPGYYASGVDDRKCARMCLVQYSVLILSGCETLISTRRFHESAYSESYHNQSCQSVQPTRT